MNDYFARVAGCTFSCNDIVGGKRGSTPRKYLHIMILLKPSSIK